MNIDFHMHSKYSEQSKCIVKDFLNKIWQIFP